MKKLVVILSALTLCCGLGIQARDCNMCNTGCKKSCKRECKPCVKSCKTETMVCPRACSYNEEQELEVVVPCPRYVKVIDYRIDKVKQTRQICPPTEAVVGKWSCCDEDRRSGRGCGRCDACHSKGVEIDPETGIMTNHPLYREAKQDPELAAKLEKVDRWNKEHGVIEGEGITESYNNENTITTHKLGSDEFNFENSEDAKAAKNKAAKEEKKSKKTRKNNKKASKNKNNDMEVAEEEEKSAY